MFKSKLVKKFTPDSPLVVKALVVLAGFWFFFNGPAPLVGMVSIVVTVVVMRRRHAKQLKALQSKVAPSVPVAAQVVAPASYPTRPTLVP